MNRAATLALISAASALTTGCLTIKVQMPAEPASQPSAESRLPSEHFVAPSSEGARIRVRFTGAIATTPGARAGDVRVHFNAASPDDVRRFDGTRADPNARDILVLQRDDNKGPCVHFRTNGLAVLGVVGKDLIIGHVKADTQVSSATACVEVPVRDITQLVPPPPAVVPG